MKKVIAWYGGLFRGGLPTSSLKLKVRQTQPNSLSMVLSTIVDNEVKSLAVCFVASLTLVIGRSFKQLQSGW